MKTLIVECQAAGHATEADADALADRFTGLVDGLALQVLASASDMTIVVMRDLLTDACELPCEPAVSVTCGVMPARSAWRYRPR